MNHLNRLLAILLLLLGISHRLQAQAEPTQVSPAPRLVRMSGAFKPANGLPAAPVEVATFGIYAEERGGSALWSETQNVTLDAEGRYVILLGSTRSEGLPVELFPSGQDRWLGIVFERAGESEQPRVLLASVPYALKAADADTFGGRPPSAYLLADPQESGDKAVGDTASSRSTKPGSASDPADASPDTLGTANFIGKFVNATDVRDSAIYESAGRVGIGTTTPGDFLHVRFADAIGGVTGVAVQNLSSAPGSYSGMLFYDQNGALGQFQGFNNTTHEYRINNIASGGTINFMIGGISRFLVSNAGNVTVSGNVTVGGSVLKGGVSFLHSFGTANTFLGSSAGNFTMTGGQNTVAGDSAFVANTTGANNAALGWKALQTNTTGSGNSAVGSAALSVNTTGAINTAVGADTLLANTTGDENTAIGAFALEANTTGIGNTAIGADALADNTTGGGNTALGHESLSANTGNNNTALGDHAGFNATAGNNNIYLGGLVQGEAADSGTIRIGRSDLQSRAFISGIRGRTTGVADAIPVMVDSTGQLGTISSSRRFKEDIRDMADASQAIMRLRPVTFRYAWPYTNGSKPIQFGLVAEEVAEVFPELAVKTPDGAIETVHYETLNVLLLNELQKQQKRIDALEQRIEELLKER